MTLPVTTVNVIPTCGCAKFETVSCCHHRIHQRVELVASREGALWNSQARGALWCNKTPCDTGIHTSSLNTVHSIFSNNIYLIHGYTNQQNGDAVNR